MTHPDPAIRASMERGIAERKLERDTLQRVADMGERNGSGIATTWRKLPAFVRFLIVVGMIFMAGWTSATTILPLNAERTEYKGYVDHNSALIDTLRAKTSVIDPFARYMLCWTTRQESGAPASGCDRSLIGTPLWAVLQEERRQR